MRITLHEAWDRMARLASRRPRTSRSWGATLTKVVSFGLGPIGMGIAAGVLDRDDLELLGAIDAREELVGRDLGQLLSREPIGISVAAGPTEVFGAGGKGVVIHATSSRLAAVIDQLEAVIGAGWNILSTCEELTYPAVADPQLARSIDDMAIRARVTVLAAGVNPGFLMDSLPLLLTGLCQRVDSIRVRRTVDTNQRRPQLQAKVGVGLSSDEFGRRAAVGDIGHVGLKQSAWLIANRLGWVASEYEERLAPVIATQETATPMGPVPTGDVLGQHQVATIRSSDQRRLSLELAMFSGAPAEDRIEIDGDPPIVQVISGGVNGDVATTALLCNLVRPVMESRPGLLTMVDILPLACSADYRAKE